MKKTKNIRTIEFISYITFKIIFDVLYINFTSKEFFYAGSHLQLNLFRYFTTTILFIIYSLIISYKFKDTKFHLILRTLFIFSTIPTLSLYALKNIDTIPFILMNIYWTLFFLSFSFFGKYFIKNNKTTSYRKNNNTISIIFLVSLFVSVFLWGRYANFNILTSFDDGNESRLYLRTLDIPSIIRYVMSWLGNLIAPILVSIFIADKKYFFAIISFIIGYLLFSINGMKTWLIMYPIVVSIFIISKRSKSLRAIPIAISIFSVLFGLYALLAYKYNGNILMGSLFSRIYSIPAEINYNYYDFFQTNSLLYLRESILRFFIESPYEGNFTFIIGELATGNPAGNANNGLFGDAYANFGFLGIITYPLITTFVFSIFINHFKYPNDGVVVSVLIILVWNLINASLFTWILTGGVILVILLNEMITIKFKNLKGVVQN